MNAIMFNTFFDKLIYTSLVIMPTRKVGPTYGMNITNTRISILYERCSNLMLARESAFYGLKNTVWLKKHETRF